MYFLFKMGIFHCYVCLPEGISGALMACFYDDIIWVCEILTMVIDILEPWLVEVSRSVSCWSSPLSRMCFSLIPSTECIQSTPISPHIFVRLRCKPTIHPIHPSIPEVYYMLAAPFGGILLGRFPWMRFITLDRQSHVLEEMITGGPNWGGGV